MNPLTLRLIALQVLVFLALALGVLAWVARPEGAVIWLVGMLSLPAAWVILQLLGKMPSKECAEQRQLILNSLIGAGLLIVGALGATAFGAMGVMDQAWVVRYAMISNALVLVIIGNGLPKKVVEQNESGCSHSRALNAQRFLGWSFVLGGLSLVILWLLPINEDVARILSVVIYAAIAAATLIGILKRGNQSTNAA